jgi:hypothetical protein
MKYFWILLTLLLLALPVFAQDNAILEQAGQQFGTVWERIQAASQFSIMRLILIIGGATLILIGWRIYNFVIILAGAITGAIIALAILGDENLILSIIAMGIGAVIGGFLAALLYYVAVFLIGAYIGAILTAQVISSLALSIDLTLAMIFGAIMGGLILLGLSFELLVILSSIVGAQMLSLGLGLGVGWTIGFMLFGMFWQIMIARATGYKIRRSPSRRMLFRNS